MRKRRKPADPDALYRRVHDEMLDSFDEELEMEVDDGRMERPRDGIAGHPDEQVGRTGLDRKLYFKELFRLQGEPVKLQDWVVHE
jgi:hypothetical protein